METQMVGSLVESEAMDVYLLITLNIDQFLADLVLFENVWESASTTNTVPNFQKVHRPQGFRQHCRPQGLHVRIRLVLFHGGIALCCLCNSETTENSHCIQGTAFQAMSRSLIGKRPS